MSGTGASQPLTAAQLATVSKIGTSIIGFMKSQMPQTIIYGFYLALMACCGYVHRNLRSLSRPRLAIFGVTILMFISTSIQFWVNFAGNIVQINTYLLNNAEPMLSNRLKLISVVTKPYSISQNWFFPFNFICSDVIVTWRAWSLCPDNRRKLLVIPYIFLCLTTVTGVLYGAFGSVIYNIPQNRRLVQAYASSQLAHLILSMLTNASATFIIWMKAWDLRQTAIKPTSSYSASIRSSVSAETIITLLLESGFVYCFLQAVTVIFECVLHYAGVPPATFGPIVEGYLSSLFIISAFYPTLIVVIVAVHRSFIEAATFKSTTNLNTHSVSSPIGNIHSSDNLNMLSHKPSKFFRYDDRENIAIAVTTDKKSFIN